MPDPDIAVAELLARLVALEVGSGNGPDSAQGRHRPESDVDLALYGELDERLIARMAGELDELPLPYSFDVVSCTGLRHGLLQEHIERVGRRSFQRSS